MSFDVEKLKEEKISFNVSIPLEQGNVFRHSRFHLIRIDTLVSIPLEQGNVFRQRIRAETLARAESLNPFGTGQCLSTLKLILSSLSIRCLNPFGTGQCLSTQAI